MGDDDESLAKVATEVEEESVQLLLVLRIEATRRLVGKYHLWRFTWARATATRCFSPPESSDQQQCLYTNRFAGIQELWMALHHSVLAHLLDILRISAELGSSLCLASCRAKLGPHRTSQRHIAL